MDRKSTITPFSSFSTLILFLLLGCIGLAILPYLSIQLLPNRSYASITVSARLSGASTEVTELELTTPLESALARLRGISNISSVSQDGSCRIRIQLDKWTDPEMFRFETSVILRQLYPQLPTNASYPTIYINHPDENHQDQAMIAFTLSGRGSVNEIAAMAEQNIRPEMAKIKGIYQFDITGAKPSQIEIRPDAKKLRLIGISVSDLQNILSRAMRSRDLGIVTTDTGQSVLYINKYLNNIEDIKTFPVIQYQGRTFFLHQLATVKDEQTGSSSRYRINGQEQVGLVFYPEEHVNNIRLAETIKLQLEKVIKEFTPEYHIELRFDQTEYIKDELNKIYLRTSLSVVILLLFVILITRQLRYVTIVIVALMANVLLSSICYYLFRLEIHLYSLAGITISLGLVIDNVIVIVEDIRHTGRNRIFVAILASTLTALGALSIVFLLKEDLRINLLDFALAVIINLLVSLPIAYFLIPAMLDVFPIHIKRKRTLFHRKKILLYFSRLYVLHLRFMLRWRVAFFIVLIFTFGLPIFLLPDKLKDKKGNWDKVYNATLGSQFYNKNLREPLNKYLGGILYYYVGSQHSPGHLNVEDGERETQLYVRISMPKGATINQMDVVCKEFEGLLSKQMEYIKVFTTTIQSPTAAYIHIVLKKAITPVAPFQLKNLLEQQSTISGSADFTVHGVGKGFNNALQIDRFDSAIVLRGYNYKQLQALAHLIRDSLLQYQRVSDVLISSRRESGQDLNYEHVIHFSNPEYLSLNRITRANLSLGLKGMAEQSVLLGKIGSSSAGTHEKLVQLYYNQENGLDTWTAMYLPLQVNDSTMLRFSNISVRSKMRIGKQMVRENQEYVLYINYRFVGTAQLNKIVGERIIETIDPILPFGYKIEAWRLKGWDEASMNYLWYIPLILLIIYMICAILLESFKQPIAVIVMIPFSFIGVFLIFHILDLHFDQGGYAALLMLSGLVTNAALYIINDLNFLSNRMSNPQQAIRIQDYIKAFNAKAMPILVTTISAILSLLPFMLAGEEKGFWFTLSAGTIGGLLFSLLGSYLLLPLCLLKNQKRVWASIKDYSKINKSGE